MLKNIRILILLYLLLIVAVANWLARERTTAWERPLNVVVYAINGDGSAVSRGYIEALEDPDFADIEAFFEREARRYGLALKQPVRIVLAGELDSRPPAPPRAGSTLSIMWWSLKLRYWAWRHDEYPYPQDIVIFVQYFDPAQNPVMADSVGLQKGLIRGRHGQICPRDQSAALPHRLCPPRTKTAVPAETGRDHGRAHPDLRDPRETARRTAAGDPGRSDRA